MQYTVDDLRQKKLLLLEYVTGSTAYGTRIETSDRDIKGVFIMPDRDFVHVDWSPEMEEVKITEDLKYFELRKFLRMLEENNPNVLEALSIPEDCVVYKHPAFDEIVRATTSIVSRRCEKAFAGYAVSEIKKAFGQNRLQTLERDGFTRRELVDFCHTFFDQGSIPINDWLERNGLHIDKCGLSAVPNMRYTYGLYYDFGKHFRENTDDIHILHVLYNQDVIDDFDTHVLVNTLKFGDDLEYRGIVAEGSTSVKLSAVPKGVKPICHVQINIDGWQAHCKEVKRLETWQTERNDKRWVKVKGQDQKIDGKNMLHMARLLNMSEDIASGRGIVVRRPEAAELIRIRRGEISLQELLENAENRIDKISKMYAESNLPQEPEKGIASRLNESVRRNFNQ
jgi:hypothetical protein